MNNTVVIFDSSGYTAHSVKRNLREIENGGPMYCAEALLDIVLSEEVINHVSFSLNNASAKSGRTKKRHGAFISVGICSVKSAIF